MYYYIDVRAYRERALYYVIWVKSGYALYYILKQREYKPVEAR
jgi:hypothetical protein